MTGEMTMNDAIRIFLHALTAVHSGTGQGADVIDLPIAREKATGWPYLPASGLKGVVRAAIEDRQSDKSWTDRAFGKGGNSDEMTAGQICLTDPRVLCLPVRSFFGTFAYVTCPLALERHQRTHSALKAGAETNLTPKPTGSKVLTATVTALTQNGKSKVYLEDIDLDHTADAATQKAAESLAGILFDNDSERKTFIERFCVVSNDVFTFLSETATEVAARVSLEESTKTVKSGGLWYEEAVPAEAIFCGLAVRAGHAGRSAEGVTLQELKQKLEQVGVIQIGGKSSVGRGLCRIKVA